ncbi:hypothetical protein BMJ31_06305 [Sinorhizobium medicae]|nr:hypothetical protein BMJ31_06305 [Sinorhizobium medicae]
MNAPFDHAAKLGIVPVIAIERASDAIALADALLEGGLPLAEITFRTVAAAEVIAIMAEKRPELLVGAGTILTPEALAAAAPFAHLGTRFVPTGGVSIDNMHEWLKLGAVAAVGGTWIATKADIGEGRWTDITAKARAAVARARDVREANR